MPWSRKPRAYGSDNRKLNENGYNEKERKKAMEYVRSFNWEKTAKETLEVYKKIYNL